MFQLIINTKYFLLLGFMCAVMLISITNFAQAGAENLWTYSTNLGLVSYGPYKSIEVTSAGVFTVALRKYSFYPVSPTPGIEVHMRNLDNSTGWKQFIPAWVSAVDPSPVITADETGVYVVVKKLSNFTGGDPGTHVISIVKLSPVDGSIIAVREFPGSLQSPVWAVAVDSQGLYVVTNQYTSGSPSFGFGQQGCINVNKLSGSRWLVQKWNKNLTAANPMWQYTSQESGGTHGDYYVNSIAINSDSIFVGGAKMNLSCTSIAYQARLESINKTAGTRNWLRIDPVGTGRINTITANDSSLFITTYDPNIFPLTSRIEERNSSNGLTLWTRLYPYYINALLLNSRDTLTLSYLQGSYPYSGYNSTMYLQNINTSDGLQIGTTTISTLVNTYDYHNIYLDANYVPADTLKLDSDDSIYVGGSSGPSTNNLTNDLSQEYTVLKKYSAFDAQNNPPTTPIVSGPTLGTVNTSYIFSAVSTDSDNDSIRYGFDWDKDMIVDQWVPLTGYTGSGLAQSSSRSWTTIGNKQFQVIAEDILGNKSGWAQYSTVVTVTPRLIICPATLTVNIGAVSGLEARYWANLNVAPTCSSGGYTDVTNLASWTSSVPTRASVSNSATRGRVTGLTAGNTVITAAYLTLSDTSAVSVAGAVLPSTPFVVELVTNRKIVRSGTVVDLRVSITSTVDLTCKITGINGSEATFTHTASPLVQHYDQFKTRSLRSAQKVSISCYATADSSNTAQDDVLIEVIPIYQEV